jgi:hypothetical protein
MALNKLFLPPGSKLVGSAVVLSSGDSVPAWTCVAVPIPVDEQKKRGPRTTGGGRDRVVYYDALTGAKTSPPRTTPPDSDSGPYRFSGYSRAIDSTKLRAFVENALPQLVDDSVATESDPGYYEKSSSNARTVTAVDATGNDFPTDYSISDSLTLADALVWRGRSQTLSGQQGRSTLQIVKAIKHLAVNAVERLDEENPWVDPLDARFINPILDWTVYSWFTESARYSPDAEAYVGESVRLAFSGSVTQVYQKAVDIAIKLPVDRVWMDYRSDGPPLVTVVGAAGSQKREVGTRYDGVVVSNNRILHCSRKSTVENSVVDGTEVPDVDIEHFSGDDYWDLFYMISNNPQLFGGTVSAQNLLQSLGFNANPLVSNQFGANSATAASKTALDTVRQAIQCPDSVSKDPKLFPTASNPMLRALSELTQLDDKTTQENFPFPLRANNPLKVKVIAGVTDLKTRFGYLGESEGIAVYRDHVGGAAAGLNYVMSMGGSTIGSAVRGAFGDALAPGLSGQSTGTDLTDLTPAKLFSTISQHLFGVSDPSGALAECATVKEDDIDSTISYAAAVAKTVSGLQTSPLTHAEWASAYQIAKNQPNGALTKTTTGVDLPAQEETETQDTGTITDTQGRDTRNTTDPARRGSSELWNPLSNFAHYSSNVWGSNGSNWIAQGIISYQQKTSNTDLERMAKKDETYQMAQEAKNPTTYTDLEWTVNTSNTA